MKRITALFVMLAAALIPLRAQVPFYPTQGGAGSMTLIQKLTAPGTVLSLYGIQ